MTDPVGSAPRVQQDNHLAPDRAHLAKSAGVSPGHSQEITSSVLKREDGANGPAPIETRINVLRTKLRIGADPRTDSLFRVAVQKLATKLVCPEPGETVNSRMIDDRIAELEARGTDGFSRLKINHDIDGLRKLQQLYGLMDAKDNLLGRTQNISNQMSALKLRLNNPKTTHSEWLRLAEEYHSKAQELDRCSLQLKGAPEGATAAASVEIMDSILGRFSNPPKPVTANFLRQQLSDMQKEFRAYAQSSGGAKDAEPYLQSVRRNLHDALSNLCARGLMNHVTDAIPGIVKTIDGLGTGKAGPGR